MTPKIFDDRVCSLGEGPLWHPERKQLYWFDILGRRLLTVEKGAQKEWTFDEFVSAAGWVDHDTLLIASASRLFTFGLETGARNTVTALEADNPKTRSNDGRADPFGGFWIGTMGLNGEARAGAIYRYYRGALVCLYPDITISNSICFSPDGQYAFYTDTPTRQIMRQALDGEGWPAGPAQVFVDLKADRLNPDGAVVDADGFLWAALWGAGRVARYTPLGTLDQVVSIPASQPSCPSIGGSNLDRLFITTATQDLSEISQWDGKVFCTDLKVQGQKEHRVELDSEA